jgi:amidase
MNLPLWWNDAGLPVGTQIMGRAGDDHVLLQLAAQLEEADPWFHRRPAPSPG